MAHILAHPGKKSTQNSGWSVLDRRPRLCYHQDMKIFVCHHLRPVALTSAGWKHISPGGQVEEAAPCCEAGVCAVEVDTSGQMTLANAVR